MVDPRLAAAHNVTDGGGQAHSQESTTTHRGNWLRRHRSTRSNTRKGGRKLERQQQSAARVPGREETRPADASRTATMSVAPERRTFSASRVYDSSTWSKRQATTSKMSSEFFKRNACASLLRGWDEMIQAGPKRCAATPLGGLIAGLRGLPSCGAGRDSVARCDRGAGVARGEDLTSATRRGAVALVALAGASVGQIGPGKTGGTRAAVAGGAVRARDLRLRGGRGRGRDGRREPEGFLGDA